jgi:LuxR family maltose regulon positive regulatory protein
MAATAVHHALTAGDAKTASELLAQNWLSLVITGKAQALVEGLDALPRHLIAGNAELALAGAGALLDVGDLERAQRCIELSDAKAGTVPARRRTHHTLLRAVAKMIEARLRGDFEATRTGALKVLAAHQLGALPEESRALALAHVGIADGWIGSPGDAREHLEQALELARRDSCEYLVLGCLSQLALFAALDGPLREAASFAQAAIPIAARNGWDEHASAAPAYLALAIASFYWADVEASSEHLKRASRAAHRSQERTTRCLVDLVRALLLARVDGAEAARIARAAVNSAAEWGLPGSLVARAEVVEAALLAQRGEPGRARETLERDACNRSSLEFGLVQARLALADGDPAEALRRLQPDAGLAAALHPASRVEARALAALARHLMHDDQGALDLLEQALAEAQANGYRQPLLSVGSPMRELLKRRVRAGTAQRALAGELMQALDQQHGLPDNDYRHLLLDPLSDREEAVLRYLPTLLSKAEIASELFVSVNTVKTHTKNIYRKLGVGTRTEAVRRARSLNIV